MGTANPSGVDAYLGPRETRFFGEGFKRVTHGLRRIVVTPGAGAEPARVGALAGITFPSAWSTKGDTAQRPHLSTIDVLVLGAQLAEVVIVHSRGLDPAGRRGMRLREVRIKAGKAPEEEGLAEIAVAGEVTASHAAASGTSVTTVTCSIATLTVTCVVEHPTGRPAVTATSFDSLMTALGDPALRTYGAAYKAVRQVIGGIDIAGDSLSATASVSFESTMDDDRIGLDAWAAPSMVDVFVTGLQLGQVLLYRLDRLPRAESNTLWMRRTVLAPGEAAAVPRRNVAADAVLENTRLLPMGGQTWRSADIVARVGGATMRCAVAHLLPAGAPA